MSNGLAQDIFQHVLALCGAVVFFAALLCLCVARGQTWEGGNDA